MVRSRSRNGRAWTDRYPWSIAVGEKRGIGRKQRRCPRPSRAHRSRSNRGTDPRLLDLEHFDSRLCSLDAPSLAGFRAGRPGTSHSRRIEPPRGGRDESWKQVDDVVSRPSCRRAQRRARQPTFPVSARTRSSLTAIHCSFAINNRPLTSRCHIVHERPMAMRMRGGAQTPPRYLPELNIASQSPDEPVTVRRAVNFGTPAKRGCWAPARMSRSERAPRRDHQGRSRLRGHQGTGLLR